MRRNPGLPKGRVADPAMIVELQALLGPQAAQRDLLIEHLHVLQDRFGHLSNAHLAALAAIMNQPMAEIYGVASFYAHFRLAEDAPSVTVRVCNGLACRMAGSDDLAGEKVPCLGRCHKAPAAALTAPGGAFALIDHATPQALTAIPTRPEPPPATLDSYVAEGGYRMLGDCVQGRLSPHAVMAALEQGGLRGMGGAGFPTARKWRAVLAQPGPRLMAVNADEGEPGTFKDRHFLLHHPHRVLEGMLIAAWAVEAEDITIYLRDEYPDLHQSLNVELAALEAAKLPGWRPVHLRRGAGAYVCGEESAMIESIEGKRGLPRHRPPLVVENGLFGRPTLVNNVETLYWVRDVVEGRPALRAYSVSGRVAEPGIKLCPPGITLRQLIEEHCGGMAPGHSLRAFLPGGASGGIFPASLADTPLDFGSFEPLGGFIGSAAVIVLSDRDDIKQVARNLMEFFAHESCGQCTPCRVGTAKAADMLAGEWNHDLLEELGRVMREASICGLGQAAPNVWQTILDHGEDLA